MVVWEFGVITNILFRCLYYGNEFNLFVYVEAINRDSLISELNIRVANCRFGHSG